MPYDLDSPILADGIKNTNYFNGRLLTAQDLRDDQTAQRQQNQQLGRAIGHGIVTGLEVSQGSGGNTPTVLVSSGLALNRLGQALELPEALGSVEVTLLPEDDESARDAGLFVVCSPPSADVRFNGGVFILAICPISGYQESAPMHDFNGGGVARDCGDRYAVEGVQFQLINVDINNPAIVSSNIKNLLAEETDLETDASFSRARNLLAHLCLDTPETAVVGIDLFNYLRHAEPPAGMLERVPGLKACSVPLALLYWHDDGVRILDTWSVRRRITRTDTGLVWPPPVSDAQLSAGEASFMQFQAHIADLVDSARGLSSSTLSVAEAIDYFYWLPAAGIVPLANNIRPRGFNADAFFAGITINSLESISYALVEATLRQSFAYPPVNIQEEGSELWLYLVQENQERANAGSGLRPQPYLLFTSRALPYLGTAPEPVIDDGEGTGGTPTLQGEILVALNRKFEPNPVPEPLTPGKPAVIGFVVRSKLNQHAFLTLTPSISKVHWRDVTVRLFDIDEKEIKKGMELESGEERPFFVEIDPIPDGTNGDTFRLTIAATAEHVTGSFSQEFVIGREQKPSIGTKFSEFTNATIIDKRTLK